MKYDEEFEKDVKTNMAMKNASGAPGAVPALFPLFPFAAFFLPALNAHPSQGKREGKERAEKGKTK